MRERDSMAMSEEADRKGQKGRGQKEWGRGQKTGVSGYWELWTPQW